MDSVRAGMLDVLSWRRKRRRKQWRTGRGTDPKGIRKEKMESVGQRLTRNFRQLTLSVFLPFIETGSRF